MYTYTDYLNISKIGIQIEITGNFVKNNLAILLIMLISRT
jgi:hypothetical protein